MSLPNTKRQAGGKQSFGLASEAVRLKRLHDSIHKLAQLMERWDNRLVFDKRLFLSERYCEGHLELLTHLDILSSGQSYNCHVVFYPADPIVSKRQQDAIAACHGEVRDASKVNDGDEKFVFVCDVELVDRPKRLVPSFVRFEGSDYIDNIWGRTVYVSLLDHCPKVTPRTGKGEIDAVEIPAIEPNEITGQEIKRRSEVMNDVSDDSWQIVRNVFLNSDDQFDALHMRLGHKFEGLFLLERGDYCLNLRDVAVGPLNL